MAPTDKPEQNNSAKSAPQDVAKGDRQARLEAALRANLKKRKAQARTKARTRTTDAAEPAKGENRPEKA